MYSYRRVFTFRIRSLWYRAKEAASIKIAWLLPKRVVMWCAYRVGANATQGDYSNQVVPDLTFMDAMDRWKVL